MREPNYSLHELKDALAIAAGLIASTTPLNKDAFLDRFDGLLRLRHRSRMSARKNALLLQAIHSTIKTAIISQPYLSNEEPLPRRPQQVLEGLLRGQSEKEIAEWLQISPNTVHVYVKVLYKRHAVHTRAELLSAFVLRNGHSVQQPPGRLFPPGFKHQIPSGEVKNRVEIVSAAAPVASVDRPNTNVQLGASQSA